VLLKLAGTGLLLAALSAPVAAAAIGPAPRHDPPREPRAAQPAPRAERQAPVELICRSVEIAGAESDAVSMVCMSAAEWRRADH
jgi:hypothetical protein